MSWTIKLVTPPTVEPVTVAQAMQHCRATANNDDGLFPLRIQAARELCERETRRAFFNQGWTLSLDHFPLYPMSYGTARATGRHDGWYFSDVWKMYQIQVPRPRLVSVESIQYADPAGVQHTLDPSTYFVDTTSEPGRIVPTPGSVWPVVEAYLPGAVQIAYTAGSYGDGVTVNTCPAKVSIAILLIVASMFENRENDSALTMKELPLGVDRLLASEVFPILTYQNN